MHAFNLLAIDSFVLNKALKGKKEQINLQLCYEIPNNKAFKKGYFLGNQISDLYP